MAFVSRESALHQFCKEFVAKVLTDADKIRNRNCAWIEYPICNTDSSEFELLDEVLLDHILKHFGKPLRELDEKTRKRMSTPQLDLTEWVPSYQTCRKFGFRPLAVVDVACAWKGDIREIWEITNTSPLTQTKVDKIYSCLKTSAEIYEIKVDDIMSIRNVHIEPEEMYKLLVSKAKKWEN